MAYVSPIDVPADPTGAVSDVSRPLLHRMNQATLSASTLHALERLLEWANAKMPEIRASFEFRQGSLGLPSEATASLPITAASIEVVSTPVEQFSTVTVVEEGDAPQERGLYTPVHKGNFDGGDDIVTIAPVPTAETPVEAVEPAVEAPAEVPAEAPSETAAAPAVESVPDEVKPKVVKKVVVKKAAE